jgi:hypothetical protein
MEAPMQAAIAAVSDSTFIYRAFNWPDATYSASFSAMLVCGVMG